MNEAVLAWPGHAHLVLGSEPSVAQAVAHARSHGAGARETTAHATATTSSTTAEPAPARCWRAEPKVPFACLGPEISRPSLPRARTTRFVISNHRGASGGARSLIRCWRARNVSTRDGDHKQRHTGASASMVKKSGAEGTIRLSRARDKPPQLARGAHNSFRDLKPSWRKRWRTLVNSVLARVKPQYTRRRPTAA